MVSVPPAIVFVNNDLVDSYKAHLTTQLYINETIDGYTFDQRIAADSTYPAKIRQLNIRLMVIRPFTELDNRNLADVVLFIKGGMASVLKTKFGPPGKTFEVLKLHWGQLGFY